MESLTECKIQTSKCQRARKNSSSQRMEAECKTTSDIAVVIHPEASLSEMSQVFAALYFLSKQRIAHTTNFEPILDLLGFLGNELKSKIRCGKNATYCSVKSIQENVYV